MSWNTMRNFLEELPDGLSASERCVLIIMRVRTGDNPTCFPSQRRIAREAGMDERSVRRVIARLELRRLISVTQRGEDQRSNEYTLLIPATVSANRPAGNRTQCPPLRHGNRGHSRQKTGHSRPKLPDTTSAEGINLKDKEGAQRAGFLDEPRADVREEPPVEAAQVAALISDLVRKARTAR